MNILNEKYLIEMANVKASDTGLPYDLWIDSLGKDRTTEHHSPRLKVKVEGKLIPIEISDSPDIPDSIKKKGLTEFDNKALILKYVKVYKDILLAHYNKQISDKQALDLLGTFKQVSSSMLKLSELIDVDPDKIIEYSWDDENALYEISVKSKDKTVETKYALDDYNLFQIISDLKSKYEIKDIKKV